MKFSFSVRLLKLIAAIVIACRIAAGQAGNQKCYATDDDFSNECKKKFNGTRSGGQCFFRGNQMANWTEAFQVCEDQGGMLAQIHTTSDFSAAHPLATAVGTAWVAGKRNESSQAACYLDLDLSFWFTSGTDYDPKFKARNTWIRTHANDDCYLRDGYCTQLYSGGFGDAPCSAAIYPMCQTINTNQNFTYFPNVCLTEQMMANLSSVSLVDCAKNCSRISWCRSFNYWEETGTCDLFTWSALDKPQSNSTAVGCEHFTNLS